MNLLYEQIEEDLRASVRALLEDHCGFEQVLARTETEQRNDLELWRKFEHGIAIPESAGGQGGSARELSVLAEEVGRATAPIPFLGSEVLAVEALLGAGAEHAARPLAEGTRIGALAVELTTAPAAPFPSAVRMDGDRLNGTVTTVADAPDAELLVVPARSGDEPVLCTVTAEAARVQPALGFDLTRAIGDVTLEAEGTVVARGDAAVAAVGRALRTGAAMLAAEQLGVAQWCLDATVAYVNERYQFARPVGSYQALKHRLADLWVQLVTARATVRYAADCLACDDGDAPVAVAMAASTCSELATHAAEEALQLHGGIGMTWEHPVHLYLKRAKANELALGAPREHRSALGRLVDIPE